MSPSSTQAVFWKKLLRLTRGRVPLIRALAVIAQEEKDEAFKAVLLSLKKVVDGGSPLSDGMKNHPAFFSPCVLELARTAEASGKWDEILQEIADGLADGTFA